MHAHSAELHTALNKLFTAFPLHYYSDEANAQRKQQYRLYLERLSPLPTDLVERSVLELIDTATYMPRIGTIHARVQVHIQRRISRETTDEPEPEHTANRANAVRVLADIPPVLQSRPEQPTLNTLVTGACTQICDVDGERDPCGRPYEYTASQARWLRSHGEHLLCTRCAGDYLDRQGELRRQEAVWASKLLAELSPQRRPSADEVKRLRMYGFNHHLRERLIAIGVYSTRRQHS